MPYNIKKSDGTPLTSIADGTKDQSTSLTLAGPNYVGYGQELNQNLVYLLENFAGNSAPGYTNLQGQLWFDKFNQVLKVFTTQGYVPVNGVTNSTSIPVSGKNGDIWYNSTAEQMYIYDDSGLNAGFKLVGPTYTKSQGPTGAFGMLVEDGNTTGVYHKIIKFQYNNEVYAILNQDAGFPPATGIPGFPFLNSGLTFSSNISNPLLATNIRGDVTGNVTGNLTGNVVATTLVGSLTGNVSGSLVGLSVSAVDLTGNLVGNVLANKIYSTNLSTGNLVAVGGYIQNLANVSAATATFTSLGSGTAHATNFNSGNAQITGGNLIGISAISVTTAQATNFSSGNAQITGGSATGLVNLSSATAQATNFSSGNAQITGGSATGLTNTTAITAQATNLSTGNAQITGGSATGLLNLSATNLSATNVNTGNAVITNGSISNIVGSNFILSNCALSQSTGVTTPANDRTTTLATTLFVHSVLPTGVIVMWGGSIGSIPAGWSLCDGTGGTPDLRGLFIVGAGGSYSVGDTGGSNDVTLTTTNMPSHTHTFSVSGNTNTGGGHTHTATVNDTGHTHTVGAGAAVSGSLFGGGATNAGSSATSLATTGISVSLSAASNHIHGVSFSGNVGNTGGAAGHENRPPYYALCYIQKIY